MKNLYLLLVVLLAVPARAIELSLEENRAERGSVGYVDMQRLFVNSPDAQHAKEGFEELIRQAEERVNLRKAELLKMRLSLETLRADRDAVVASSMTAPAPVAPAPTPAPAPAAAAPAPAPSVAATTAAAVSAPVVATASTTTAVAAAPHAMALPGMSPSEPTPAAPPSAPAASTTTNSGLDGLLAAKVSAAPAVVAGTTTTVAPAVAVATTAAVAPIAVPAGPTLGQRLLDIDGKIISLQGDILRKEGELTREHDDADRGLLDVESRKTDQVLARLYRAITEVARREGVSVVVDKTTILYGHPAVDITDKVLKYLKEAPQP